MSELCPICQRSLYADGTCKDCGVNPKDRCPNCHSLSPATCGCEIRQKIALSAISVVNGTKDSVIFVKIPETIQLSQREMNGVLDRLMADLIGTSLQGAKIVLIGWGIEITIAMPEDAAKLNPLKGPNEPN